MSLLVTAIATIVFLISSFFTLLVVHPFTSVLARHRANYTPKSIHLDPEDGAPAYTGTEVRSYFETMGLVHRTEVIFMVLFHGSLCSLFHEGMDGVL